MGIIEIVIISISLAMDAFAVSICKGLSAKTLTLKHAIICGSYFGVFQGMMPLIGYVIGIQFKSKIENIDHWIAFILLTLIGINMLKESFSQEEDVCVFDFSAKAMIPLAIATSIDALAVGVTFAFLDVNIISSAMIIAIITFGLCLVGVKIGHRFGLHYKSKAEMIGGIILILIGFKILLEHLNVIPF